MAAYLRHATGWTRQVVDAAPRPIGAGTETFDIDDDGDLDILGKPYSWDAPRLDVWINEGR